MAAYAALVSLDHIINNLHHHSRPPITLHKEQAHLLTEKLTFLQQFLEIYNPNLDYSKDADPLETRIARAAYAAEDAIESHILDQSTNNNGEKMSSDGLYEALEKVIQDMAQIEEEAMEIKETVGFQNQLHTKSTPPADSSRSTTSSNKHIKSTTMVGADDLLLELKDKLTADARDLQTIPIVGMGGSGKTTLALNIYQDALIEEHFDIRAWVTISQEYKIQDILKQVLTQLNKESSGGELGEVLHKHLYGSKYIIILDDMWSLKAWDGVRRFLPNNKMGSRIVITTRLTALASALPNSNILGMKLLDGNASWDLLSKTMFGERSCCPPELEKTGKKIAKGCKGLPLSIVVVGGLLSESEQSIESWEYMEKNLNAIVNLEDDEHCLKTLYMSYKQLPIHLKPCFLYMGIYREDHVILISRLVKFWVAEGFLKRVSGKRPEDVARMYLKELVDRNLIMIHKLGSMGSIKKCKVHDLLRDLCLREAQKEGFYNVYTHEIGDRVSRIVISGSIPDIEEIDALTSTSPARSLILDLDRPAGDLLPRILRLLRIVGPNIVSGELRDNLHQLVNSRCFTCKIEDPGSLSLISLFWNLQTLVASHMYYRTIIAPNDIWYMSHIRHLDMDDLYLPDPPPPNVEGNDIVLANLQTLGNVKDFTCSEQMVKTIPNIKKLRIHYDEEVVDERFCLANLDCLDKLESLAVGFKQLKCSINYPQSLKKLALVQRSQYCWEDDILDKIGALPLLQKLKLYGGTFKEGQWETTEGQFRSLKILSLYWCKGLRVWTSEASHFSGLEQLRLSGLDELKEIPLDFAEISALTLIDIVYCSDYAIKSAKRIVEEQEAFYGEDETTLQVQVELSRSNDSALKRLRGPNFHVTLDD